MTYFQVDLPEASGGEMTFNAACGNWDLSITLRWPEAIQEVWDEATASLSHLGSDDPLVTLMGYRRDYDYIKLYSSIEDKEAFLTQKEGIPLSIQNAPADERMNILDERIAESKVIAQYMSELKEHLKWLATVVDQYGEKTEAVVEPGGWFNNQTNDYSFKFFSDKEYIGFDDLQYAKLMVRTK